MGADRRFDAALAAHLDRWPALPDEAEARWFAERTALLLSASILLRHAPGAVSDAFVATRIAGESGRITGAMAGTDVSAILDRIAPAA